MYVKTNLYVATEGRASAYALWQKFKTTYLETAYTWYLVPLEDGRVIVSSQEVENAVYLDKVQFDADIEQLVNWLRAEEYTINGYWLALFERGIVGDLYRYEVTEAGQIEGISAYELLTAFNVEELKDAREYMAADAVYPQVERVCPKEGIPVRVVAKLEGADASAPVYLDSEGDAKINWKQAEIGLEDTMDTVYVCANCGEVITTDIIELDNHVNNNNGD